VPEQHQVVIGLAPDQIGVEGLLVADLGYGKHRQEKDEDGDVAHIMLRELDRLIAGARGRVHRDGPKARHVDDQTDRHADAGGSESPPPRDILAEASADKRRQDTGDLDTEHVELKTVRAAFVAGPIQGADLPGVIAAERAEPQQQEEKREQKGTIERHQDMADRHHDCPGDHGAGLADPAIRDRAADDRREISEPRVEPEDVGGELLRRLVHITVAEQALESGKAPDLPDMIGLKQPVRHVEHKQRLHAIISEALERTGEREGAESERMAKEGPAGRQQRRALMDRVHLKSPELSASKA